MMLFQAASNATTYPNDAVETMMSEAERAGPGPAAYAPDDGVQKTHDPGSGYRTLDRISPSASASTCLGRRERLAAP